MEDQILDDFIKEWLDTFEANSHLLKETKSHAQDGYAQGENQIDMIDTLTYWRLKAMAFRFKGNQLKRFKFHFYLILS